MITNCMWVETHVMISLQRVWGGVYYFLLFFCYLFNNGNSQTHAPYGQHHVSNLFVFLGTGASIFFFCPLARQNIFHLLFFLWIPSSFIKPGLHFPPKNKKKSRGLIIGFVSRYHSSEWPFHHGSTRHDCYWSQIPTC